MAQLDAAFATWTGIVARPQPEKALAVRDQLKQHFVGRDLGGRRPAKIRNNRDPVHLHDDTLFPVN